MAALRTSVFVSESNEVQPNKRVCVKEESFDSKILQSMLFKVFRRVCLLPWNIEQRSIQYSKHSYKVDLNNFENYTWICANVNDLTLVGVV